MRNVTRFENGISKQVCEKEEKEKDFKWKFRLAAGKRIQTIFLWVRNGLREI